SSAGEGEPVITRKIHTRKDSTDASPKRCQRRLCAPRRFGRNPDFYTQRSISDDSYSSLMVIPLIFTRSHGLEHFSHSCSTTATYFNWLGRTHYLRKVLTNSQSKNGDKILGLLCLNIDEHLSSAICVAQSLSLFRRRLVIGESHGR